MRHAITLSILLALVIVLGGCPDSSSRSGAPPVQPITQVGSTTILPIADLWQKAFNVAHPEIKIAVSGGGSGAGIKALIAGSCHLANASRRIKAEEQQTAQKAGVQPVEKLIAYDALAVVVNRANPLQEISVANLSDVYTGRFHKWSELGGGQQRIQLVSRESGSGTYDTFRELVVALGGQARDRDFHPDALSQTSTQGVLATVASTKGAIGYVGLGYGNDSVKVLAVIPLGGVQAGRPTAETVGDKSYPLARELYIYTNGEPTGAVKTYLDWALGPEGQKLVEEAGYIPVS